MSHETQAFIGGIAILVIANVWSLLLWWQAINDPDGPDDPDDPPPP